MTRQGQTYYFDHILKHEDDEQIQEVLKSQMMNIGEKINQEGRRNTVLCKSGTRTLGPGIRTTLKVYEWGPGPPKV